MRNIIYLLSALLLGSCIDYDDVSREVSVQVKLQMPEEFTKGSDLEGHEIVMSQDGNKLTATTNAEGIATFTGLIPDVYDISCSWEITNEQYMALTGEQAVTNGCTVSGSLNEQLMSEAQEQQPILLPTHVAVKRDIVIGKIAAAGSKDGNNRNYLAGRYVELYNQADNAVDVSGLYIGLLETTSPQPYTLDNLHEDYADSVVIVKQVFQIPADKPYMVAPGGTVLLTNSATDHSDVNEFEYDLTDANFESKDETGKPMNTPAVPALITSFSVYGKTTGSLYYLCVPKRVILDGVDYLKNKATGVDVSAKRLYADIDAGYTNTETISGYTGEVVYRRTASIAADGHKILMDTNNSLNDFKVSTTIKPRQYDEE